MFRPKEFYRKLETLFQKIESGAGGERLLRSVLHDVVEALAEELHITDGALYRLQEDQYELTDCAHVATPSCRVSMPLDHPELLLVKSHKTYIFPTQQEGSRFAGWPRACLATVLGPNEEYLLVFGLAEGWEREQLEFSFNTLRNYVNQTFTAARLRHDLLEARIVQTSLLPKTPPQLPGFACAGRSVPAEVVGGDFYDWIRVGEESVVFAVGDASGHGIPAALQVRDVVTGLRMGLAMDFRLAHVAARLNHVVYRSDLSTRFVSVLFGELDVNGNFIYVNAGHVPPLIVRANTTEELTTRGMVLGPNPDATYRRGYAKLDPEDLLILYTDGIIERTSAEDQQFGEGPFRKILRSGRSKPLDELLEEIFAAADVHGTGAWGDDATVVLVKRLPEDS
jgi:sigma-B regulation protein RsbU (phosphoserine phosphatase)